MLRRLSILLFLSMLEGCGLLAQTMVGWHSRETVTKTEQKQISISTSPEGAEIVRRGPDGREIAVGRSPTLDTVDFRVEQTVESPRATALLIGGLAEGGSAAFAFVRARNSEPPTKIGLTALGGLLGYLAVQDLIVALIHGLSDSKVVGRKVLSGSSEYLYAARRAGLPDGLALIRVPEQVKVEMKLEPVAVVVAPAPVPTASTQEKIATAPAAKPERHSWILAVMSVEDLNAGRPERAVDPSLLEDLGNQVRVFVTQRGIRAIDRGSQERTFSEQIRSVKSDSYKTCYDDSCQIELGKALAASHILRSRVARFGSRCVLNAELIDLRAEVSVLAASAQGGCEAEGFLTMSEAVANEMFGKGL